MMNVVLTICTSIIFVSLCVVGETYIHILFHFINYIILLYTDASELRILISGPQGRIKGTPAFENIITRDVSHRGIVRMLRSTGKQQSSHIKDKEAYIRSVLRMLKRRAFYEPEENIFYKHE